MSQCVKKWKVGTEIEIRGPFGNLQYSANKVLNAFGYKLFFLRYLQATWA